MEIVKKKDIKCFKATLSSLSSQPFGPGGWPSQKSSRATFITYKVPCVASSRQPFRFGDNSSGDAGGGWSIGLGTVPGRVEFKPLWPERVG